MRKFIIFKSTTGFDGYSTTSTQTVDEEAIKRGLNVCKYDSIMEVLNMKDDDPIKKIFEANKAYNEAEAEHNRQKRIEEEGQ